MIIVMKNGYIKIKDKKIEFLRDIESISHQMLCDMVYRTVR